MSALDALLGTGPVACRRLTADLASHFWAEPVKPGDPCLCGELPYRAPAVDEDRTDA